MKAFLFAFTCIALAHAAAASAEPPANFLLWEDGTKELGRRLQRLRKNESDLLREKTAATPEKAKELDREIVEIRREIRETEEELRSEVRQAAQEAEALAREQAREAVALAREQAREAAALAREQVKEAVALVKEQAKEAKALAITLGKELGAEDAALVAARRLRMQGDYSDAAKAYQKFIAENPNALRLFEARFWFAKCKLSGQKWDDAAEAFTDFLKYHSDQRTYSQQAKEDRIYCWKVRFDKNPKAAPGLKAALKDPDIDIRVQAALALAEGKDASGRAVLEENLVHPRLGEQCGLALWKLGLRDKPKAGESPSPWAKMLVIKVKSADPNDSFEMRVPVHFFKGVAKMLPEAAKEDMARKGLDNIADLAASAPKGQVLFQFREDNGKTNVVITVD